MNGERTQRTEESKIERLRVGKRIYAVQGGLIGDYKSLNQAKRESRLWQQSTGKLGDGRLRVSAKAPT